MKILVINSGSSSIKYQLFDMPEGAVLAGGLVDRIGLPQGSIRHQVMSGAEPKTITREVEIENHQQGLELVAGLLVDPDDGVISDARQIGAVGHRVVHGGERFSEPTVINREVIEVIRDLIPLAPLHNPANLKGIEVAQHIFRRATQVAVFDTAFHQTMPAVAYRYAIPQDYYADHHIRVYGFHGTSHRYVTRAAADFLGKSPAELNLISAHLGNGCSITAVRNGRSVDTSMGFSPLAGLIMGTRSGDLDPAVVFFMHDKLGMPVETIDRVLNKESGMLGLTGNSDLRDIQARGETGDAQAQLALDMYTYRIKKYIGAYAAILGRVDALVFTAGVGENSAPVRQLSCQNLDHLGIVLDRQKNEQRANGARAIHATGSTVQVLVIPTNEELQIALDTQAVLQNKDGHD